MNSKVNKRGSRVAGLTFKGMCGRYRRTTQEEELARLYHIPIPSQTDMPISYNIAPSQKVLTIRFNPETRVRSLDALQWGLSPYWAKDPNVAYRTINARALDRR
jgi:putative SOS response-associated peptidase YedK